MIQLLLGGLALWFVAARTAALISWPYLVGVHIAVGRGVAETSAEAFMLGWFFQSIYIGLFLALVVAVNYRSRGQSEKIFWRACGTFVCTIIVVTYLASVWPGSPT